MDGGERRSQIVAQSNAGGNAEASPPAGQAERDALDPVYWNIDGVEGYLYSASDAQPAGTNRDELTREGGQTKVPCLKITDAAGKSQWLYDSTVIIGYLRGRFAAA